MGYGLITKIHQDTMGAKEVFEECIQTRKTGIEKLVEMFPRVAYQAITLADVWLSGVAYPAAHAVYLIAGNWVGLLFESVDVDDCGAIGIIATRACPDIKTRAENAKKRQKFMLQERCRHSCYGIKRFLLLKR